MALEGVRARRRMITRKEHELRLGTSCDSPCIPVDPLRALWYTHLPGTMLAMAALTCTCCTAR